MCLHAYNRRALSTTHCLATTRTGGGGSAVSGMDGITLTDMGGGWVLSPCDQIAADAYWTKNLWNFKIIKFENMHLCIITILLL